MRFQLVVCLALVTMVCAQTAQPASSASAAGQAPVVIAQAMPAASPSGAQGAAPAAPEPPKVGPEDPVITIKGFCSDPSLKDDACKTVITKDQFDKLVDSLQPNMAPAMRRRFATQYISGLTMSTEADKRHLDKNPEFETKMRLARMQILSQELTQALHTDANNVSDTDIKEYYDKNLGNYEQATLIKIFVPHTKHVAPPADAKDSKAGAAMARPGEEQEKQGEEAMKKEADALRERLIKGEDPDKLEKAAFAAANLTGNPPPTKMERMRRTSLPMDQQRAMDLKAGDVSEVISDASGNYIYKMVSKETVPLESVTNEIRTQLSNQRYREAMQKYQANADFNDAYFGPTRAPGMPVTPRNMQPAPPSKDKDKD